MRKIILWLCFFALQISLLGNSSLAFQERPREATLINYQGEVQIQREGKEGLEKPTKNFPLFSGDTIITPERSWAQISLADGGALTLHSHSLLYLNLELNDEEPGTFLLLLEGCLTVMVLPKPLVGSFQAETYSLLITARETIFTLAVALDGSTRLGVEKGTVKVQEADGGLTLKENQEIRLESLLDLASPDEFSITTPQEYKQRREEDWELWQKRTEEYFLQNPLALSQKMLQRLESALKKERDFLKQIDQETNQLNLLLEEAHKAKKKQDFETFKTKQESIITSLRHLKESGLHLRRLNNRLTTVFELGKETGRKLLADKKRLGDNLSAVRTNYRSIKNSAAKVRLVQQEARRIIKERLPRLHQQTKALQEEK